jgi:hypothetical protein
MAYAIHSENEILSRLENKITVDTRAWLLSSLTNFKSNIDSIFPGVIFRTTISQLRPQHPASYLTQMFSRTNEAMLPICGPGHETKGRKGQTIDQWSINDKKLFFYNDHIHFNGILTHAMLHQVLNELCPGKGDSFNISAANYAHLPRGDLAHSIVYENDSISWYVDGDGLMHKISTDFNSCTALFFIITY